MKLLEDMSEIERFLIEHVFTDIEDGGVGKGATKMWKVDQQGQGQLEEAKLSKGDIGKDKYQEMHQVLEEYEENYEDLMNGLNNLVLHGEWMLGASRETQKSHVFKNDELCMTAGCEDR